MEMIPLVAAGAVGFGLAHVVLGGMEMNRQRKIRRNRMR
jgi:hypothetical protein